MAEWPLMEGANAYESASATITCDVTSNVKGSYTTLVASLASDVSYIILQFTRCNSVAYLIDIAIGAAASETVIIPNISVAVSASVLATEPVIFPISIPAGTRISARAQSAESANTLNVNAQFYTGTFSLTESLSSITSYGANTGTSVATQISATSLLHDPTVGYTQITSSTTSDIKALIVAINDGFNFERYINSWMIYVSIGGSGSEQTLFSFEVITGPKTDSLSPAFFGPVPCDIPSGARLSILATTSNVDGQVLNIALYGVR